MKILIVVVIVIFFAAFVYMRLRPYIRMARQVFGSLKGATAFRNPSQQTSMNQKTVSDDKLVRCIQCGIWVPSRSAIRLRTSTQSFCSNDCLEGQTAALRSRKVL